MINLSPQKTNNNKKRHKRKIVKQSKVKNYSKKKKSYKNNKNLKSTYLTKLRKDKQRALELSHKLEDQLEICDDIAKKTGFLIRHAKILPLAFISTLAFGLLGGGDKSLNILASNMYNWFGIRITAQALSKRLSQKSTADFLRLSFIKVLNFQLNNCFKNKYRELFSKFSAVIYVRPTTNLCDEPLNFSIFAMTI